MRVPVTAMRLPAASRPERLSAQSSRRRHPRSRRHGRDRGRRAGDRAGAAWRWGKRALLVVASVALLYQIWLFAHVWYWIEHHPTTTALMQAGREAMQRKTPKAQLQHRWVSYERISSHLKRAVVAAEDAKFLDHDGFDWKAIQQAYEKNLEEGRIVAGGSTISQQLAKNLFLSAERTPWRKAQEAVITVMIEALMSKRRILELYLNVVEWGNGVFGAEAAARHYFGTSAAALTARQAARLAAMVPNPRYYDWRRHTPHLEKKTLIVRARMRLARIP